MQIYCNSPENFNDPFDGQIDVFKSMIDECKNNENLKKFLFKIKTITDDLRKETRMTCFSRDSVNKLLWSHYGNSHTGVCIGYDLENLYKMEYSTEYPEVSELIKEKMKISFEGLSKYEKNRIQILDELYKISFLTKSVEWEYEKEYRAFIEVNDKQDFYIELKKENIKSIYFGLRTSEEDKKAILQILKDKEIKIPIYQMEKVKGKFLFEPKLISE